MFTPDQIRQLDTKLDPADVKTRAGANGGKVPYIEAWDVIEKANNIFGYAWSRETALTEIHEPVAFTPPPTRENPHPKTQVVSAWRAKVRITIFGENGRTIIREGCGGGRAFAPTVGEAVE